MPGQGYSIDSRLVDYSSTSESESETEIVDKDATPKHPHKMGKRKLLLTMQGIMALERPPGIQGAPNKCYSMEEVTSCKPQESEEKGSTCMDKGEN